MKQNGQGTSEPKRYAVMFTHSQLHLAGLGIGTATAAANRDLLRTAELQSDFELAAGFEPGAQDNPDYRAEERKNSVDDAISRIVEAHKLAVGDDGFGDELLPKNEGAEVADKGDGSAGLGSVAGI